MLKTVTYLSMLAGALLLSQAQAGVASEPVELPAGKLVPGNNSIGSGSPESWKLFKQKFGYATDEEALKTKESPIDLLEPLSTPTA